MEKIERAKQFLKSIGMPKQQQTDLAAYTLLTLANISRASNWRLAENNWIRIHDVLAFALSEFGKNYAENTRETIRKNCMHQFREAALIEDNGKPTNSPNYRYRLTPEALQLIRTIGSDAFQNELEYYLSEHDKLIHKYESKKKMKKMSVCINGNGLSFSPGKHNQLQKAIIEEFAPRFVPNAECLYVGDTTDKELVKDKKKLSELGFEITLHDKMPDVVLYSPEKNWIYFVEAVTSVGPMSPQRILDLQKMTKNVDAGIVYVTAFLDLATYKKFVTDLAWETEVWIADLPDHMIHLNGDKFLGPRKQS